MKREYTTEEGYTLRVFSSGYLDWGLEISIGGEDVYYSPCALSRDSYGSKAPEDMEWEEAEEQGLLEEWTPEDWRERLKQEADDLIESYTDPNAEEATNGYGHLDRHGN
tara:strand:+ start:688 stop:1014 length:327 start_codon:yes stop_codon:yes gene_type:complete